MLLLVPLHFPIVQPFSLVSLQDSLSLTHKLTPTRLFCLAPVLTCCLVSVHFSSEFLLIFKTHPTLLSYLQICTSIEERGCLYTQCSSCSITSALLPAVSITETQCSDLPFLYWCVIGIFMFSSINFIDFFLLSLVKYA